MSGNDNLTLAVQQAGFALYDAALFLDTHPNDTEALAYFNKCKEDYNEASKAYGSAAGPLTMYQANGTDSFNWLKTPWPWEAE
ncbi:MAG: spore coat protein CotJB [Clostridia bacterium]|nr:spore coat protein CotJB [Clostridia bacterium]